MFMTSDIWKTKRGYKQCMQYDYIFVFKCVMCVHVSKMSGNIYYKMFRSYLSRRLLIYI